MYKIIKSKCNRRFLPFLLVGFISMNTLAGCSLLINNESNNETDTDVNGDTKEETENQREVVTEAYIKAIDREEKTITVDQVELLFSTDEERLKEIGMKGDDLVTGFYIYNEDEKDNTLSYDENLTVELLEDTLLSEGTMEELNERILKNHELCKITVKDNIVVRISQIYLP